MAEVFVANLRSRGAALWPGVLVSGVVAIAATFLAGHYGAPLMLFALLLGMALNFLTEDGPCKAGIELVGRAVLRWGVALLGLRITLGQVLALGWQPVALAMAAVLLTIAFGMALARLLGFRGFFGLLTGGAVGICGASAALALSTALPRHPLKERATVFTVVGVSTLSTLAMVLYPLIARTLGLDAVQAGTFLGGTIHDVAQVVGAGYSLSPQAGDTATLVKLVRVAMLVPVIVVAAWLARRHLPVADAGEPGTRPPLLPWFAVAFFALVAVNSAGWVPASVVATGKDASQWCLAAAMAAIGMKTHLKDIVQVGWKPVALMLAETLFLAGLVLGALRLM